MSKEPIYPKPNPEYRKMVLEAFYKKVRETRWDEPEERVCKPRGRKPKAAVSYESKPRTAGERVAAEQVKQMKQKQIKQSKYNWL